MSAFSGHGPTLRMAVTTTSAVASLPSGRQTRLTQARVRVTADSASAVHFHFARSSEVSPVAVVPTAGVAGHRGMDPGGVEVFSIPPDVDRIAAICATGTATLDVTLGDGD